MHKRREIQRTELGKGTRSILDNLGGLGHNFAILGLDHLDHNTLLGLSDTVAVAAARAVAGTRAVATTVSAGQTTGITARVAAVAAACTFHGITAIAR